jgi:hypothetical protein
MRTKSIYAWAWSLLAALTMSAATTNDLVGNWHGTLDTGTVKLRLIFKITKSSEGKLTAKLDSVDQGARDIPVETVLLTDKSLRLEVKSVNGVYTGTLDATGKKAAGEWKQGAQALPLTLEQGTGSALMPTEKLPAADEAANQLAAQKIAGIWNGTLAAGGANLRLRVHIAKTSTGAATGTLDSLDQGANGIPLTAVTLRDGKVHFEARGIGGLYEGSLDATGEVLAGQWKQGGQTFPLDLTRALVK